ncbi:MAG: hypothetical protein RQ966_10105 [Acetobacteraceae bacterium]|nr:hypothetical protein [Acetobacteraceae bacterium]
MDPETLAFIGTSDLSGSVRGAAVPWTDLDRVMERGVLLPGHVPLRHPDDPVSAGRPDLLLLPDPATRAYVPAVGAPDIVMLLGDLLELDGAPWASCPRYLLRRALAALHAEYHLSVQAGFAQRFILPGPAGGGPRSLAALRRAAPFCGSLLACLRANRIAAETMQPGDQPGEFEVAAQPAAGITAADQAVILRELIPAVAAAGAVGRPALTGVRIGFSLWDGLGGSAMSDSSGEHGLSDEAEHWTAGLVHHLPVVAAVVAPAGVGDKRWSELAVEGRPGALRLCSDVDAEGMMVPARVELDLGDAGASPYLALGALVWAGLDGLRQHRRLFEQSRQALPRSRAEAMDWFGESVCVAEWFGMDFREQFLRYGRRRDP